MTETLMIRVGQSQKEKINWLIWSTAEQEIIASGELSGSAELADIADKTGGRNTIVLLPASCVQLRTQVLPARWSRKLEQALPYMLEDELACDLEQVMVVSGEAVDVDNKPAIRVALCNRAWFEGWLATFKEAGIETPRILPDALLLPGNDDEAVSAVELDGHWLFRLAPWQVAEVEASWLPLFCASLGTDTIRHYSPMDIELAGKQLEPRQQEYDLPLALFARNLSEEKFNLRQGRYQYKKASSGQWKLWQPALVACGIALAFSLTLKGIELHKLHAAAEDTRQAVLNTYQNAFPGEKVRPQLLRSQLKNKLSALEGGSESGFLQLAEQLADVMKQNADFKPETLRFDQRRNELRVRASAKDFQTFGKVKSQLEQLGASVEQGSLNSDDGTVVGEIRIKGAA